MSRFAGRVARTPQAALKAQPAPLLRDGLQVLLRGFIGNRQTLLREGRALGLIGEHEDDAALCAVAYRRWGADLNAHVLGEYAVALFDPAAQTLLLTRDGLGLQPLFYSGDGERLAFASHLDALLTIVEPGALDARYLGVHLTFAPHAFDRTPFVNIAKLIPGHSLRWRPGRLEQIRSWRLSQARTCRTPRIASTKHAFANCWPKACVSAFRQPGGPGRSCPAGRIRHRSSARRPMPASPGSKRCRSCFRTVRKPTKRRTSRP